MLSKGENIAYAIEKEVCRNSFIEWLKEWDIEEEDFYDFMDAGKQAIHDKVMANKIKLNDKGDDIDELANIIKERY